MLSKLFEERLGLTLVVLVAGLATALIKGNGLAALVVSVVLVLLVGVAATTRHRAPSSESDEKGDRRAGDPFFFRYVWKLQDPVNSDQIAVTLGRQGLKPEPETNPPNSVVLKRGSQLYTRLFGGYFIDPKRLPIRVELVAIPNGDGRRHTIELKVADALGIAIRDKGLEARYARAAADISTAVEQSIRSNGYQILTDPMG